MHTWLDGLRRAKKVASLLRHLDAPARKVAVSRLLESRKARRKRFLRSTTGPAGRLVFVCHGNIMRSAFAAAYLRQLAPQHAELIVGAGTHATEGRAAQDSALRVSAEFGVSLHAHAATALSSLVLRSDDVIVCMDRANEANVISRHGVDQDRVFVIGDGVISDAADRFVDDPYALGDDATRAAFHQIVAHTQRWRQILGA